MSLTSISSGVAWARRPWSSSDGTERLRNQNSTRRGARPVPGTGQETVTRRGRGTGRRTVAACLGLALSGTALVVLPAASASADACTSNVSYSSAGSYCFLVPAGTNEVRFDVSGAQGGSGGPHGAPGGLGAEVVDDVAVTPGQTFEIILGGAGGEGPVAQGGGSDWADGGYNGGGRGGGSNGTVTSSGGGGGGASDIRTADGTNIIVAGGGGGGGGNGGTHFFNTSGNSGGGGGDDAAGEDGLSLDISGDGYDGGPGLGGSSASSGKDSSTDNVAPAGQGGDGECIEAECAPAEFLERIGGGGGGGGGGAYPGDGGGAGSGAWESGDGGGGGGGSSYAATAATYRQGVNSGDGRVRISYFSTVTVSSTANPSVYQQPASFTASISPTPTAGQVAFTIDGYTICPPHVSVSGGTATCNPPPNTNWSVGTHAIQASYSDPSQSGDLPSAGVLSQVVLAQTSIGLNIAQFGGSTVDVPTAREQDITLVATVNAIGAPIQQPLGTVTFYLGSQKLASVLPTSTANGQSQATYQLNFGKLPNLGIAHFSATYAGTTTTTPSTSATLNHAVDFNALVVPDNSTSSGLSYVGSGWGYYPNRPYGDYDNDVHATTQAGDYVSYAAVGGNRISIYGERDPYQGTIGIYWNGQLLATEDTSGPDSNVPQQLIWSGILPTPRQHGTLTVENLSQGEWFTLDQLVVDPTS